MGLQKTILNNARLLFGPLRTKGQNGKILGLQSEVRGSIVFSTAITTAGMAHKKIGKPLNLPHASDVYIYYI